jgi:hypothetical protein
VPAAISVTVSNGSTLGSVSGVESRLAIIAIDNAGTVELAVVNATGYGAFDERVLINTTAEGGVGAADSASVIYSTSARTSVAFRVVGYVSSTQATAGAWATTPSNVTGVGGNKVPQDLVSATAQASTSGTSIDFTSIPSWVKRVTVMFNGVSTNGTSPIIVQLAASGSVQTTGYTGTMFQAQQSQTCVITTLSSGFNVVDVTGALATQTMYGTMTLNLVSSNDFMATGLFGSPLATERMYSLSGYKSLGAALDRVRITTVNGTDTFDAGSINIMYE